MDPKQIQELIELISRSNFKSFELEKKDFKLRLVKEEAGGVVVQQVTAAPTVAAPAPVPVVAAPQPTEAAAEPAVDNGLIELKSPIVGTFYSAPSPGAPDFVAVGKRVSQGQVICIVEAMKVMNEIESEVNAEVVEVLVSNGQPVEYGEVLFRLRPA